MYQIHLTNNSTYLRLATVDGRTINPKEEWQSGDLGNFWLYTQQFGPIGFYDLGDKHIPGDTSETWGVLITYQGEEFVGRYEGGGRLDVAINDYGQATIRGMHIHQVLLPPVILDEHVDARA
jgi:hypothetical protein